MTLPIQTWRRRVVWAVIAALVAFGLALLLSPAEAQAIYRCGRTYSDTPCGVEAVKIATPAARPSVPQAASIKPGWSEAAALGALADDGWPVRTHVLESGTTNYKQYVIGRHSQNQWYIFTRDGVVTSVLW